MRLDLFDDFNGRQIVWEELLKVLLPQFCELFIAPQAEDRVCGESPVGHRRLPIDTAADSAALLVCTTDA